MNPKIDIEPKHRHILLAIFKEVVPDCQVWAYGSRVKGDSHDGSDLDLVLIQPEKGEAALKKLEALRRALVESSLPILVQVMDWHRIPKSFREEIERQYVVLWEGKAGKESRGYGTWK